MIRVLAQLALVISFGLAAFQQGSSAWYGITGAPPEPLAITSGELVPGGVPLSSAVRPVAFPKLLLVNFTETAARPVFFEGRVYPVREQRAPAAAPPPPPPPAVSPALTGARLVGIISQKSRSRALISVAQKPSVSVLVGEVLEGGWRVERIGRIDVVLSNGIQTATLEMFATKR
jgi:hypothetical protein